MSNHVFLFQEGDIDTLFVTDDSAGEEEKVTKKKENRTEDKTEDQQKTTKQVTEGEVPCIFFSRYSLKQAFRIGMDDLREMKWIFLKLKVE